VVAALLAVAASALAAPVPRFLPDDPLRADPDDLPIAKPAEVDLSTAYDVLENTFQHRPDGDVPPAVNVSTIGEVPDSSWFTNRIGARPMTVEDIARGVTTVGPPDVAQPLTIIASKSGGITPGFTMRDARGHVYFVKFDPAAHPNLSTAADVISSRFFHAFGYHVSQNDIAYIRREQLRIDPKARVSVPGGKKRPMTEADLDRNLATAARLPDGRIRIVASLALAGEPLGPFQYRGTRSDDANDVFPHEHRRELRGLRVFAAWLNHDDSRSVNTQDMFMAGDGGGYVRHHLIDFSSTLGSGSNARREIAPQNPRAGNEYVIEVAPMLRTLFSLGLWERPWRKVRYPEYPGVGNIEADFFRPEAWRPEYPNPAFERMQDEDAFWAAAIVHEFSDDAVRAAVATGDLGNPDSERYLADTLIRRRDKILAHYFARVNPLAHFAVENGALRFRNLGAEARLGRADGYLVEWSEFDNVTGGRVPIESHESGPTFPGPLPVPVPASSASYLAARISTRSANCPAWATPVTVYLRRGAGWEVVGIDRRP
jgi:hypothetical protein